MSAPWIRRILKHGRPSGGTIHAASPPCDRCGKPTGRPFLLQSPRTVWHCPACEAAVTDLLLAQFSPGRWITDPDEAEALGLTTEARRLRGEESSGG